MALIPVDLLDTPTHEGRFTPREVIAHLADWEAILREERMGRAVREPGCTIVPYDEELRAIEHGYATSDVGTQLARFAAERARTVAFIESLTAEQLSHAFHHPERGATNVNEHVAGMLGHDVYHIDQLTTLLASE